MKEIMDLLKENAKITPEKIARITGIPLKDVKKKINMMEKKGIIVKYKAVFNSNLYDDKKVLAVIDIKVTPERGVGFDTIARRINKFPEVKTLYLMSGGYDLLVMIEGDTLKEVASFVSEKLAPMVQVQSTYTHFLLKKYKEDGDILTDDEKTKRLVVTP